MNVLIVDDQRLSRAGLAKMIEWDRLGLVLAGESANGRDALERIGDTEAEIVITDVRMPVMDGLQLIEKAREQYPDIAWVVVSGYDDFAYVRKSVQLTVADYLLKPVDPGELNELLAKLARTGAERRRKAEAELRRWREQFFHFLLEGAYGEAGAESMAELLPELAELAFAAPHDRFAAAVFESDADKPTLYETFRPLEDSYACCLLRVGSVYVLIAAAPVLDSGELAHAMRQSADCGSPIRRISLGAVSGGIGSLRQSVGQALDAYAVRTSRGTDSDDEPVFFDALETDLAARIPLSASWEREWTFHLRQGNRREALDHLAALLADIGHDVHPDIVDGSCQYVLLLGARELHESGQIGELDFLEACRLAGVLPTRIASDDKKRAVTDFFRSRLKETDSANGMEARQAIEHAKAYIDTHFCQSLNLTELAQSSYMSPGHFSSLFRQHTGKNFLEYMTELRIEHAKSLLTADPGRKIGDVAQQCGYQDTKYFRKLFKRHTGLTPAGYKEELSR